MSGGSGWYPDRAGSGSQRYWDGTTWTEHTAPTPSLPPPYAPVPPLPAIANQGGGFAKGRLSAIAALVAVIVAIVVIRAVSSTPTHPAANDIEQVMCNHTDSVGYWHAIVRITNHTSRTSDYAVTVEWDDASGARLQSGSGFINGVAAGQNATGDIEAPPPATAGIPELCKAVSVTRTAS